MSGYCWLTNCSQVYVLLAKVQKKGTMQESVRECDKKKLIIKNNNTRKRKKTQLGELILSYF